MVKKSVKKHQKGQHLCNLFMTFVRKMMSAFDLFCDESPDAPHG
jgi:hypothetical protein